MKVLQLIFLFSIGAIFGCKERKGIASINATEDYKKGISFFNLQNDSAYYYFNKAANSSKDSSEIAQAYNNMAVIQSDEGDYYGAQESLLTSLKYLDEKKEKDLYCLVSNFNELGSNSLSLRNYDAAITYYDKALDIARDSGLREITLNNKAVAYQRRRQYTQAITIYESIISQSKKNRKEYARVLCNLASVKWLKDSSYQAAPDLLMALQIRKEENDEWGLNSSYAHLADYYQRSRPDSALGYARAMHAVASRLNSPDDQLEALDKLIRLSPIKEVKFYFLRYRELKDSLETARNNAKNQFALIRYDSEKNKTDNLRLQRENALRKAQVLRQRAISAGVILVLIVLIAWGIAWSRKKTQKLEWEKERAKQDERIQISQKVHDVVANGLYQVMTEMEYGKTLNKDELLDKIELLYNQSRDISYEPAGGLKGDFEGFVQKLLSSYGNEERKVVTIGNSEVLWKEIDQKVKNELQPILQELMVNMDKHSGARNVLVRFEWEGTGLKLQYMDDGVGLRPDQPFGNGLTNTGNRIAGLGGLTSFEQNTPSGVRISIYLPNT